MIVKINIYIKMISILVSIHKEISNCFCIETDRLKKIDQESNSGDFIIVESKDFIYDIKEKKSNNSSDFNDSKIVDFKDLDNAVTTGKTIDSIEFSEFVQTFIEKNLENSKLSSEYFNSDIFILVESFIANHLNEIANIDAYKKLYHKKKDTNKALQNIEKIYIKFETMGKNENLADIEPILNNIKELVNDKFGKVAQLKNNDNKSNQNKNVKNDKIIKEITEIENDIKRIVNDKVFKDKKQIQNIKKKFCILTVKEELNSLYQDIKRIGENKVLKDIKQINKDLERYKYNEIIKIGNQKNKYMPYKQEFNSNENILDINVKENKARLNQKDVIVSKNYTHVEINSYKKTKNEYLKKQVILKLDKIYKNYTDPLPLENKVNYCKNFYNNTNDNKSSLNYDYIEKFYYANEDIIKNKMINFRKERMNTIFEFIFRCYISDEINFVSNDGSTATTSEINQNELFKIFERVKNESNLDKIKDIAKNFREYMDKSNIIKSIIEYDKTKFEIFSKQQNCTDKIYNQYNVGLYDELISFLKNDENDKNDVSVPIKDLNDENTFILYYFKKVMPFYDINIKKYIIDDKYLNDILFKKGGTINTEISLLGNFYNFYNLSDINILLNNEFKIYCFDVIQKTETDFIQGFLDILTSICFLTFDSYSKKYDAYLFFEDYNVKNMIILFFDSFIASFFEKLDMECVEEKDKTILNLKNFLDNYVNLIQKFPDSNKKMINVEEKDKTFLNLKNFFNNCVNFIQKFLDSNKKMNNEDENPEKQEKKKSEIEREFLALLLRKINIDKIEGLRIFFYLLILHEDIDIVYIIGYFILNDDKFGDLSADRNKALVTVLYGLAEDKMKFSEFEKIIKELNKKIHDKLIPCTCFPKEEYFKHCFHTYEFLLEKLSSNFFCIVSDKDTEKNNSLF